VLSILVMTAESIGIDPRTYLRDVMLRIAHETDVAKLTPHGWQEHFQAEVEAERDAAMATSPSSSRGRWNDPPRWGSRDSYR